MGKKKRKSSKPVALATGVAAAGAAVVGAAHYLIRRRNGRIEVDEKVVARDVGVAPDPVEQPSG